MTPWDRDLEISSVLVHEIAEAGANAVAMPDEAIERLLFFIEKREEEAQSAGPVLRDSLEVTRRMIGAYLDFRCAMRALMPAAMATADRIRPPEKVRER